MYTYVYTIYIDQISQVHKGFFGFHSALRVKFRLNLSNVSQGATENIMKPTTCW